MTVKMFTEHAHKKKASATVVSVRKHTAQKGAVSEENDTAVTSDVAGPKPFSSSTRGNALRQTRLTAKAGDANPAKKLAIDCSVKTADKEIQANLSEEQLVTGDTPSAEYWKLLAEQKEKELEAVRAEKLALEDKIEDLEGEKTNLAEENANLKTEVRLMEDMLEDAKKLAEYIEELPDDVVTTDKE